LTLGITVASRYAEALMLRAKDRSLSLVVVEGASDSRMYRRALNPNGIHILWLNGKSEALDLIERFRATRIAGNVGILDADFDRLFDRKKQGPQIVWTSENDMETMVLRSEAYVRVFPKSADQARIEENRNKILAISSKIGCVRALSEERNWGVDFKSIEFESFVDRVQLTCDLNALCEEVLRKNPKFSFNVDGLAEELNYFEKNLKDESHTYHGHDLCRLLRLCQLRLFGSYSVGFDRIANTYTVTDFMKTSTWTELEQWERTNPGFQVISNSNQSN
jgi:hypothetical protein